MTPVLAKAANMTIRDQIKTSIVSGESLNTKELSQVYTMCAIVSSGFSLGKYYYVILG